MHRFREKITLKASNVSTYSFIGCRSYAGTKQAKSQVHGQLAAANFMHGASKTLKTLLGFNAFSSQTAHFCERT